MVNLLSAEEFNVPLKTLEKWITAYHKNNHCFEEDVLYNDFHIISDSPINNNNDINYDELKLRKSEEERTIITK